MTKPEQLTFPWSKPNKAIFNHFYLEEINLYVKDALLKQDDLFLYGIHGTGKSFLLQALCNEYTLNKKTSLYIPMNEVKHYGSDFIDSLEELDLICIDDIDLIAGNKSWETAIFNLINNCLISKCRIIFSSQFNQSTISFNLADLFSRLKKMDHIEVLPVSESNLKEALKFITNIKSMRVGDNEINYLITHSNRSFSRLVKIIDELDIASIKLKRRITIPLIKEII